MAVIMLLVMHGCTEPSPGDDTAEISNAADAIVDVLNDVLDEDLPPAPGTDITGMADVETHVPSEVIDSVGDASEPEVDTEIVIPEDTLADTPEEVVEETTSDLPEITEPEAGLEEVVTGPTEPVFDVPVAVADMAEYDNMELYAMDVDADKRVNLFWRGTYPDTTVQDLLVSRSDAFKTAFSPPTIVKADLATASITAGGDMKGIGGTHFLAWRDEPAIRA